MVHEYRFDDQMAMSDGVSYDVKQVLLKSIPGALQVNRAHQKNDKNGTDWWVEHEAGKHLSVDAKIRDEDWAAKPEPKRADDLALETWSVVENKVIGWTRNQSKQTDYILWFWKDTGRWCLVPFAMLCSVFQDQWKTWARRYGTFKQLTTGWGKPYHSECVFVPREVVLAEICRKFSGVPGTHDVADGVEIDSTPRQTNQMTTLATESELDEIFAGINE